MTSVIAFLRGIIFESNQESVIIEVGGVGYEVSVHPKEAGMLKQGDSAFLFTDFIVREDLVQLFGFLTPEGLRLFKTLISASGIGPKTALAITGVTSYRDFAGAVFREDTSSLVRLPGVGKKTAQKMILELKDKLVQEDADFSGTQTSGMMTSGVFEAREALTGLGFSPSEVEDFLREALKVEGTEAASDVLVKHVLQSLGGKGADNGGR